MIGPLTKCGRTLLLAAADGGLVFRKRGKRCCRPRFRGGLTEADSHLSHAVLSDTDDGALKAYSWCRKRSWQGHIANWGVLSDWVGTNIASAFLEIIGGDPEALLQAPGKAIHCNLPIAAVHSDRISALSSCQCRSHRTAQLIAARRRGRPLQCRCTAPLQLSYLVSSPLCALQRCFYPPGSLA